MKNSDYTEYVTWMDFTQRMQCTTVSQEDWTLFVRRYMGFIHDRCIQKGWTDLEQDIMDRCVLKFNDDEIKKVKHDRPGSLRAWLFKVIETAYADALRERNKGKNQIIWTAAPIIPGEDTPEYAVNAKRTASSHGYFSLNPDKNKFIDRNWDEEKLWQCYVSYLVFDIIKKNTSLAEYQVFVWRECKHRTIDEIAQATGCTIAQVYEYSRAVRDKLQNQFKKFGEMQEEISAEQWDILQAKAQKGYRHYRKIADEYSTLYTGDRQ